MHEEYLKSGWWWGSVSYFANQLWKRQRAGLLRINLKLAFNYVTFPADRNWLEQAQMCLQVSYLGASAP